MQKNKLHGLHTKLKIPIHELIQPYLEAIHGVGTHHMTTKPVPLVHHPDGEPIFSNVLAESKFI